MSPRWRSIWRTGQPPLTALPTAADSGSGLMPLPHVAPPTNHYVSPTERIYRQAFPPPPVRGLVPTAPPDSLYADPYSAPLAKPQIEATPTPVVEADPQPPVIQVPPRDLAEEVGELVQPVGDYLAEFIVTEPVDDFARGYVNPLDTSKPALPEQSPEIAEFESRKAALLGELQVWADKLLAFIEAHRDWRVAELRQQHGAAWRAAREQDAVVDGLLAQSNQGTGELRNLKAALSKARFLSQSHEAAKPDLDRLPSQQAIDQWRDEDTRLKASWSVAEAAVNAALDGQRSLSRELERESRKQVALRQAEAGLRAKLSGEAVPLMGLESEPEL